MISLLESNFNHVLILFDIVVGTCLIINVPLFISNRVKGIKTWINNRRKK